MTDLSAYEPLLTEHAFAGHVRSFVFNEQVEALALSSVARSTSKG